MNDLAQKALHGLDVARRQASGRPMLSLAVVGLLVSVVVVVAGGRVGAARATRPLTTWLNLQDTHAVQAGDNLPGAIMLAAVVVLVLLWLVVVQFVRRSAQPQGRVWWLAVAWAAPFAIGPPLMDTSVYSYAAYGLLQRSGRNPYEAVPSGLGDNPVIAAIDPGSRGTPNAAGPLGTLVQHLSVSISSGSALGAVIVLRVVGVLGAVWIGRLAVDLAVDAGGNRGDRALTLTVLNPLVLLYVVSAAHLDGLMIALVLGALLAAGQRRWLAAVTLACLAGSVTGQGFLVLPVLVAVHWLARRSVPAWRVIAPDVLVAALVTGAVGLAVPGGFGWITTVDKQFAAHTPFSAAGMISTILNPVVRGASFDDLAIGGRITAMAAMICVAGYLVLTARHRAWERSAGYALLAMALLAPALNPWYLLWGILCLAPTATGPRRTAVLGLSAAACVLSPPGFSAMTTNVLTGALLAAIGVVFLALIVKAQRGNAETPLSAAG